MHDVPRVRFAPSPTGFLHIGGARTALFNYLFARNRGGSFLLRIEDTDQERSSAEMTEKILEGMQWLGLVPDEDAVHQSRHREEHVAAAMKMLESGHAYRCFCSREQLDAERAEAEKAGRVYRYGGHCRDLSDDAVREKLDADQPFTVRMKIPQEGVTRFKDMVYKNIEVVNREIDDFILLRSDGNPVYHLAVVVDDARMGITHVIRGEDHLSNTAKQIHIYLALGHPVPRFGHLPLILGPDGKRLSKRSGATSVEEFRDMGFLPEGVVNSLALLGWSHKSNVTVLDRDMLVKDFDMSRVNKKGAIFDLNKMIYINGQHISRSGAEALFPLVAAAWLKRSLIRPEMIEGERERLLKAIDLLKQRMKLIGEFIEYGIWVFRDPENYDEAGTEKYWQVDKLGEMMQEVHNVFSSLAWQSDTLERRLREVAEKKDVKAAVLIHALRLAVTGFTVSPDLFSVLEFLGRETVLRRLKNAIPQMGG